MPRFAFAAHTIPFNVVPVLVLSFVLLDRVRIPSKAYYCNPAIYKSRWNGDRRK